MPEEYFNHEFNDVPNLNLIPIDYKGIKNQPYIENSIRFSINPGIAAKLFSLEKSLQSDTQSILLSAFGILLYRYSSQNDFVIGVPFEIRKNIDVNIVDLPIRFIFHDEPSFGEILGAIKNKINTALEKSEAYNLSQEPFEIKKNGKKAAYPFRVLFEFNPNPTENTNPEEMSDQYPRHRAFDLNLQVFEENGTLECQIIYNQALYAPQTIARFSGHFQTILTSICEKPQANVQKLQIITDQEYDQIIRDWNNTESAYPKEKCIHHLFEEQAIRTPNAIAVEFENEQLTYAALNAKANQLARFLHGKGACEDQTVALFVERGLDMITGLLAISKTGATYLPLDPIYPKARLSLIVNDAKPVIFLTQKSLTDSIPDTPAKKIYLDDKSDYSETSTDNLTFGNSRKAAYILYTSGSTGIPKGVPITQMAVVNLVYSMRKLLEFTARDILLAVTTISFDIAELEMYMPLFTGAKLVIATQETATDMELLAEKIEASEATIFQATPVTFKMLMINSWKGKKDLKLIIGGEALSKELVRELLPICNGVWNSYGPTETAIYSVVRNLTMEDAAGEGYVPIGKPLDNTKLYVLNMKLVPVPVGIPGELYIGGDGLSPGYLNLPEMTDERFILNPFVTHQEEKIYKTGDLVQYFNDGNLVFLNRVDSQVKIRGFRIELGEIESAISQFQGIKDNVVIVREDTPGDKKLVGYLILNEPEGFDLKDLRHFLTTKLPDYMVPAAFMVMDQFPVTLMGKSIANDYRYRKKQ